MSDCEIVTRNGQQCIYCPPVEAVEGTPEQIITDELYGWNAVAESQDRLEGDVYTEFTVPAVKGVVCGFSVTPTVDPRSIGWGFYVYQSAGSHWWRVQEAGAQRTTAARRYAPFEGVFRIERSNGFVTYLYDGEFVYRSAVRSRGGIVVAACLYAAGDQVD